MSFKRTPETERKYHEFLMTNPIPFKDAKVIMDFKDWQVIKNDFPYDFIFKTHHLLIPTERYRRFTDLPRLTQRRYHVILAALEDKYDTYFVNMPKNRTVLVHWHCHLAKWI